MYLLKEFVHTPLKSQFKNSKKPKERELRKILRETVECVWGRGLHIRKLARRREIFTLTCCEMFLGCGGGEF